MIKISGATDHKTHGSDHSFPLLLKAYFKYFYTLEETTKVSNKQEQLHKLQA